MRLYHGSFITVNTFHEWDELKLTDKIFNMYEMYHSEDLQNAFDDIDKMCAR